MDRIILVSWRPRDFLYNNNSRISPTTSLSLLIHVVSDRTFKKVATSQYKFLFTGKKLLGCWLVGWLVFFYMSPKEIMNREQTDQLKQNGNSSLELNNSMSPFIYFWCQQKWKVEETSQECLQNISVSFLLSEKWLYIQSGIETNFFHPVYLISISWFSCSALKSLV